MAELTSMEGSLLSEVEKVSEGNFITTRARLVDFYRPIINPNQLDIAIEGTELTISELRIIKALSPYSISVIEDVPTWIPESTRKEILAELAKDTLERSDLIYAYSSLLGLVSMFRSQGMPSSTDPLSGMVSYTGSLPREIYEQRLAEIARRGDNNLTEEQIYPNYAVVEKQDNPQGYIEQVANYGRVWNKKQLGILTVINMEGKIAERSVFTIGDSTYCRTNAKIKQVINGVKKNNLRVLEIEAYESNNTERLLELENELTIKYGEGVFVVKVIDYGGFKEATIIPTKDTTIKSVIGQKNLVQAHVLHRELVNAGAIVPTVDPLEAQILGPLRISDCETVYISFTMEIYVNKLITDFNDSADPELVDIAKELEAALSSGKIRYQDYKI